MLRVGPVPVTSRSRNRRMRPEPRCRSTQPRLRQNPTCGYNRTLGEGISRDPIAEKGGVNLYGFVGNRGANRYDLLGLYDLQFDWFDGFTDDEKKLVRDTLTLVGARAKALQIEIQNEIDRLTPNCGSKPCLTDILKQLEKLKKVMKKIEKGVASKSENLEFEKADLGNGTSAQLHAIYVPMTDWSISTGYDPVMQLNINTENNGANIWNERQGTLPNTFLHELSHKYGTEDGDSEGELFNADQIERLYDVPIEKWGPLFLLLEKCDPSLLPPGKKAK